MIVVLAYVAFFAYSIAYYWFAAAAIAWFFDVSSFWSWILAIAAVTAAYTIFPPVSVIGTGILFYFLAFVADWNLFAAALFCLPGLMVVFLGLSAAATEWLRNKLPRL